MRGVNAGKVLHHRVEKTVSNTLPYLTQSRPPACGRGDSNSFTFGALHLLEISQCF